MARTLGGRLTDREVRNAQPPKGCDAGLIADGGNLYLQCSYGRADANSNERPVRRSWVFRYELAGRRREAGLGPLELRSLSEAREKALEYRKLLLDGIDPLAAKEAARAAAVLAAAKQPMTFEQCAKDYIVANRSGWKNVKHAAQWTSTFETYVFPKIGKLRVGDIDTNLVLQCLQPIWETKTETASRVRGRIEAVFDRATALKYRQGDNPARWAGNLEHLLPKRSDVAAVEHHPALPFQQTPAFMTELREREGVAAQALQFTILTAARTNEVIGATWPEIDLKNAVWDVPAERMKGSIAHRVPLSPAAVALLRGLPIQKGNEFVFLGSEKGDGLSNAAMDRVIKRINAARTKHGLPRWIDPKENNRDVTVHGFRSTARDWAAECSNFPHHVQEMMLAHKISNEVEAAYRRGDLFEKRKKLMAAWAQFCGAPAATGNVTPLRRRADA